MALFERREHLDNAARSATLKLLTVENPASFTVRWSREIAANQRKPWSQGVSAFRRLVGRGSLDGKVIWIVTEELGRSEFQGVFKGVSRDRLVIDPGYFTRLVYEGV